jgi:hypothetical protein
MIRSLLVLLSVAIQRSSRLFNHLEYLFNHFLGAGSRHYETEQSP